MYEQETGGFLLNHEKERETSTVNVTSDICKYSSESWRQIIAQLPGGTESKLPDFEDWNIWCFLSPHPLLVNAQRSFVVLFFLYKHNQHNKEDNEPMTKSFTVLFYLLRCAKQIFSLH